MTRRKAIFAKRYFTLEQANKMLPLVRSIVADVAELAGELQHRHEVWQRIRPAKHSGIDAAHEEELEQIQKELATGAARVEELVDELRELGVELKSWDGLVDFPCLHEGREVYLCWRLGEGDIEYWHELDSGFAGRQLLTADFRKDSVPATLAT